MKFSNSPSDNDSDLSRPAASVIDQARGVLILRNARLSSWSAGFVSGCVITLVLVVVFRLLFYFM